MEDEPGNAPSLPQLLRAYSDAAKGSSPLLTLEEKDMFKTALLDDGDDEEVRWAMAEQLKALQAEADMCCQEVRLGAKYNKRLSLLLVCGS